MNIKNIMMAFLLGAELSLCVHTEGIDTPPAENVGGNNIYLDWSEEPYMRLIDEYSGGVINVWQSKRKSLSFLRKNRKIYYVDYPWIVRIPEKLQEPIQVAEIPNAPEVERGYYLYNGCYLASAPQCSLDQVKKELVKKGIENPYVQLICPRKVTLRYPSIPGIQFIESSNDNDVDDGGVPLSPLTGLTIAVPAKDKETFEKAYKEGSFNLIKEQVLEFKDLNQTSGKRVRTFSSVVQVKPDLGRVKEVKLLTQQGNYAFISRSTPTQTFTCHSDKGTEQTHIFEIPLPDEVKNFNTLEGININLNVGHGGEMNGHTNYVDEPVIDRERNVIKVTAHTFTRPSEDWTEKHGIFRRKHHYHRAHESHISITPTYSFWTKDEDMIDWESPAWKEDDSSIFAGGQRISLNSDDVKKTVSLDSVEVIYMNGQKEYYVPPTLPTKPGKKDDGTEEEITSITKMYGTISLRYERNNKTGELAVVADDLLYKKPWLVGKNKADNAEMEKHQKEVEKALLNQVDR